MFKCLRYREDIIARESLTLAFSLSFMPDLTACWGIVSKPIHHLQALQARRTSEACGGPADPPAFRYGADLSAPDDAPQRCLEQLGLDITQLSLFCTALPRISDGARRKAPMHGSAISAVSLHNASDWRSSAHGM